MPQLSVLILKASSDIALYLENLVHGRVFGSHGGGGAPIDDTAATSANNAVKEITAMAAGALLMM